MQQLHFARRCSHGFYGLVSTYSTENEDLFSKHIHSRNKGNYFKMCKPASDKPFRFWVVKSREKNIYYSAQEKILSDLHLSTNRMTVIREGNKSTMARNMNLTFRRSKKILRELSYEGYNEGFFHPPFALFRFLLSTFSTWGIFF